MAVGIVANIDDAQCSSELCLPSLTLVLVCWYSRSFIAMHLHVPASACCTMLSPRAQLAFAFTPRFRSSWTTSVRPY